ncbi:MAG: hypothetical protein JO288_15705 [Hyphomicrobiales bacterium]|nr:hypothetical protein [Hyphomicrobiales bacterium]
MKRSASALIGIVAALALMVQLLAVPYHQARAADGYAPDVGRISAALRATFGDAAVLCTESEGKGAPTPSGCCDDQCLLCRSASQAFYLVAPDGPGLPVRQETIVRTLGAAPERGAVPLFAGQPNRARAPPLAV